MESFLAQVEQKLAKGGAHIGTSGALGWQYSLTNHPLESEPHSLATTLEPDSEKVFGKDSMIFALYGQSKAPDGESVKLLNDLVLVFSYNPISKKSVVVALPTQLYLERQSKEQAHKLRLANGDSEAKVSETNQAVQQVIQLPIDRYIGIDLDKFAQFVDDIDGLTINEQTLSGPEVKAYLQENLEDADTAAQFSRLKQVIDGLIAKVAASDLMFQLSLLSKANKFMIDHNFALNEWTKLAEMAPNLFGNVDFIPLPLELDTIDNETYQVLDSTDLTAIKDQLSHNNDE